MDYPWGTSTLQAYLSIKASSPGNKSFLDYFICLPPSIISSPSFTVTHKSGRG